MCPSEFNLSVIAAVILLCVRWYLVYHLRLRDLEEMMAERGLKIDHCTVHLGRSLLAATAGALQLAQACGRQQVAYGGEANGCISTERSTASAYPSGEDRRRAYPAAMST